MLIYVLVLPFWHTFIIIIRIGNNTGDNKLDMPGFHAKGVVTVTLLFLLVMFLKIWKRNYLRTAGFVYRFKLLRNVLEEGLFNV